LLFLTLNRMTRSIWRSGFVAALFAIHPLHVESVAWIAERKDVLSGFFWILTMWAYVDYVERPDFRGYIRVALALILGLMSKPMLVTLPFALLLLDYWPLGRFAAGIAKTQDWRRAWLGLVREKVPLLAIALASSVIAYAVQQKVGAVSTLAQIPAGVRVSNALVSYVEYIEKTIWPARLAVIYPHPGNSLPIWQVIISAFLLVFISVLILRSARRLPYLAAGWIWYLITLLPVIGFIPVGAHAMADRFTYIPLIGLFIGSVWLVAGAAESKPALKTRNTKAMNAVLATAIILLFMGCSYTQTSYWSDSFTLFNHAIAVTSRNNVAYNQLGAAYHEAGDLDEAVECYKKSFSINSHYVYTPGNLAKALADAGRFDEAIPVYLNMLRAYPKDARTRTNLAKALERQGKIDEAIRQYKQAVAVAPDYISAYGSLGNAYMSRKKYKEAIEQYLEILRIDPTDTAAHTNLAVAYYNIHDYASSWAEVHKCESLGAEVNPDFLEDLWDKLPDPSP
ncbi:MAG: tetratricopeptide repeat protein, partial [Armatimonadota bacterium]|nr:tetratricopeptide repeat protein [Armatimonadota bacterium]